MRQLCNISGNWQQPAQTADGRQQTVAYPDGQRNKQAQVTRRRGAKVNLSLLLIAHTTRWPASKLQLRFFRTRTRCWTVHAALWSRQAGRLRVCVLIELHANCPCKLQLQPRGGNCIALDAAVATLLLIKEFQ